MSGLCWAVLVVPVLRHWKTPTAGVSFLLVVATEGLAVLGADLAVSYRAGWLVSAAVAALVLGLAFYVFTAARFDLRDLLTGKGDHWVAGGALAICALAAGHITQAAAALGQFSGQHQVLTTSTLVLWCLAVAWLPPLVTTEILRPRLGYDVRRWATVFPLGMYAGAASLPPGHRHHRHHRLRPGVDVGRVHRLAARTRRAAPAQLAGTARSAPPGRPAARPGRGRGSPGAGQ